MRQPCVNDTLLIWDVDTDVLSSTVDAHGFPWVFKPQLTIAPGTLPGLVGLVPSCLFRETQEPWHGFVLPAGGAQGTQRLPNSFGTMCC